MHCIAKENSVKTKFFFRSTHLNTQSPYFETCSKILREGFAWLAQNGERSYLRTHVQPSLGDQGARYHAENYVGPYIRSPLGFWLPEKRKRWDIDQGIFELNLTDVFPQRKSGTTRKQRLLELTRSIVISALNISLSTRSAEAKNSPTYGDATTKSTQLPTATLKSKSR